MGKRREGNRGKEDRMEFWIWKRRKGREIMKGKER